MFRSLLPLLVAACIAASCSPPGGNLHPPPGTMTLPPLERAEGRLVSPLPVVVVASPNWVPIEDQERWSFAHSAAFAVWVDSPPPQPLVVSLSLDEGDPASLRYRWDGETVGNGWARREGDVIRLEVPAGRLTEGVHSLAVVRTTFDAEDGPRPRSLRIGEISWSLGDHEERIDPHNPYRQFRIARFLLDGVMTSQATEHLGGILFDGPGSALLPVDAPSGAVLRATVQNVSPQPATFTVRTGSGTVEEVVGPNATAALSVPLGDARRTILLTATGAAKGLFLWGAPYLEHQKQRPLTPIVFVTLDTTRRDAVPPYGGSRRLMPNLTAVARRATIFERAVSTAPWTLPSHSSMFTGLYPSHHLGGATLQALPNRVTTLAEILREHGWVTAGFAGGFFSSSRFGVSQGFMVYHEPEDWEIPGDRLTDLALGFLDNLGDATPFLFINLFDAHEPYLAPAPFRTRSGATRLSSRKFPRPWDRIVAGEPGAWVAAVQRDIPYPPAAVRALRAEYEAEVSFDDHQLGRLLKALRERRLLDRTLLVIVADHGELLGEHRLLDHGGRLDPELVHVPLLIKFPGQREAHTVSDVVSVLDLFPTVLETAGISPPPSDGLSLTPGNESRLRSRTAVFSEEHEMGMHRPVGRLRMDRHVYGVESLDRRSVAWSSGEECFERQDGAWRAAACTTPGITMRLVKATLGGPDLLEGGEGVTLSASDMEKLKAIGYVH